MPATSIEGLAFRPLEPNADADELAALVRAANLHDHEEWVPTAAQLRNEYANRADFEASRDGIVAELDGRLVAYGAVGRASVEGVDLFGLSGAVHPALRRRGLGGAILAWQEGRARERAVAEPSHRPGASQVWLDSRNEGLVAMVAGAGYTPVRYGFQMVRDLAARIDARPLPDGLEVRPVRPADHRRIWDADAEAFRDHWGHRDRTDEDFARWFGDPDLDTALWQVAWDGDEVAGSVMTFIHPAENAALGVNRGWLEHVSVRRRWRGRGLARALITEALLDLAKRGIGEASLGVDAENANGAVALYESLGFRQHARGVAYRRTW